MAFLGGALSNHRVRLFSTAFKGDVVRRLESGEALAAVSKELGIARKLLYESRWAWGRPGAAGLTRRRGPKKGLRRKMATGDPPGAALASSAPSAEGTSGRVGAKDCSFAPLKEPDVRASHPALWIDISEAQRELD